MKIKNVFVFLHSLFALLKRDRAHIIAKGTVSFRVITMESRSKKDEVKFVNQFDQPIKFLIYQYLQKFTSADWMLYGRSGKFKPG